ncbi:nuclear transport factor 2 family protein [Jiangella alba]|uniref:nuclear transport factor 2 family protein n=1 Tax=Jiangella alba TaxID=561176 RepID=UPI00083F4E5B|nr:nuclear transport factor 2 family protein [Jiangella alba]
MPWLQPIPTDPADTVEARTGLRLALLTEDAVLEMPPVPLWYRGRDDYGRFMARLFVLRGADWRTVPVWANGQPAFAAYRAGTLHTLQVFAVDGGRIAHTVVFQDPRVFELFGLALQ